MGSNLSKVTGKLVVELTAAPRPPHLQFHTLPDVPHWQEQEIGRRLEVNVSCEHWWWECCHYLLSLHRDHSEIQGLFPRTDFPRSFVGFPMGCISGAASWLARLLCNRPGRFPLYRGASREGRGGPHVTQEALKLYSRFWPLLR